MKTPSIIRLIPGGTLRALVTATTLAAALVSQPAQAATQYATGTFTWDDASTAAWSATSGGPYTSQWTSGDDAILEGVAGTVTISGSSVHNLTFHSSGYTLNSLTSTLTLTGTAPTISLRSGMTATIRSMIAGSVGMTKAGTGDLTLLGANSYTGATTMKGGTLTVGNGTIGSLSSTDLTFTGTGTFNVTEAASSTQGMGALTFTAGEAKITSTAAGATSPATLTFASMAARTTGATATFSLATNTTSTGATPNKIVLTTTTNAPLSSSGSNNPGIFFGTADFARYDTVNGYFRAVAYGSDSNATTTVAGNQVTIGATTSASDISIPGTITGQTTGAAVNTIKSALAFTQAAGTTLSMNGYFMTSTGSNKTIKGGYVQPTADGGEIVLAATTYSSGTNNYLYFQSIIQNFSGGTLPTSVTIGGPGVVRLDTYNTYTGVTRVNSGILRAWRYTNGGIASSFGMSSADASNLVINSGTLQSAATTSTTDRLFTIGPAGATLDSFSGTNLLNFTGTGSIAFSDSNAPALLTLTDSGSTATSTFAPILSDSGGATPGANVTSLTKSSTGIWSLLGANTYTGPTTITGGTLKLGTGGSLSAGTNVSIAAGATFDLTTPTAAGATYTWNMNSLSASGAATAATISGTALGTIDMGAKPIVLTYNGTNAALTVTGATLALGGNPFTVVVPGTALGAGIYTLVSTAGITGTVNPTPIFTGGNGLAVGATGEVSISGADVILTVTQGLVTYTVAYDGNTSDGGSVPVDGSSPYASGATVTVLGNTGTLTKAGHVFSGWNTAANGSGTPYAGGATFAIAANTTLYAQWTALYTVTYDGNTNDSGSVPVDGSSPYTSGSNVTVLGNTGLLTKTNFVFLNWNTAANGSGTTYNPAAIFAIAANTTLYAQWVSTTTYSVTYDGNGSDGGTVPVDGGAYLNGATVTVSANTGLLTRTGYLFTGWNTASNGSGTGYAASGSATFLMGTSNVTLYAQWVASYTVTYDGNGSTGGTVPVDGASPHATGSTVTVLGNSGSLSQTGYLFTGWNTAANGSGTPYSPAATFAISTNTTLYAQWVLSYTVTYDGNGSTGGSVPVDGSSPHATGSTVTVLGNTGALTLTGFALTSWNTQSDGLGTPYAPAATFAITTNTTLYAQWTVAYYVTYDGNGSDGGTVPTDNVPHINGATVTVKTNSGGLSKTGLSLIGWNTLADGTGTDYAASGSATFLMGSANVTLYAKWSSAFTVIYDGNGSDGGAVPVDPGSPYASGATVTVLGNTGFLTKTGYNFAGWNTASNGSGTHYNAAATFAITVNTTLYAQWDLVAGTWSNAGATDGNWNTASNWVGGLVPGSTAPITGSNANTSTAYFNTALGTFGTAGNPVVIDSASENITAIVFDVAAGDFVIGSTLGNPLYLTNAGITKIPNTLTATNAIETINAPLVIEGAAYTLSNNSANGSGVGAGTLYVGGGITGGAAVPMTLTLRGANTNANTVSGLIAHGSATSLAVTKLDAGTWILANDNSYAGATTISVGTLKLGAAGGATNTPLGTTALGTTVASSGALDLNGFTLGTAEALTINGTGVSNTGALTNSGAAATYSGVVTLNAASSIGGTGDIALTSGLVGNFTFTKSGGNALTLNGASSRTGTNTLSAGKLILNNDTALGSALLTISAAGTTIDNTSGAPRILANGLATSNAFDFSVFNSGSTATSNLSFTGAVVLAIPSSGTNSRIITLNGTGTTLSLGAVTGQTNAGNGTLVVNGPGNTLVMASLITSTQAPGTNKNFHMSGTGNMTINGEISNPSGTGYIDISSTGTLTLNGSNIYTGVTQVNTGTVIVGANAPSGSAGAFGIATSPVTLGVAGGNTNASILIGGAYNVGRNIRILTNSTVATRVLTLGGNTAHHSEFSGNIILGTDSQVGRGVTLTAFTGGQVTFSGIIQNPAGMLATVYTVTKAGLGTVVLSNINTYTGDTQVSEGALELADNAGMKFVVADASHNKITGAGTATLKGDFTIDTSAVTLSTGSWTLVDAATKSFDATFTVAGAGWSESSNVWTKVDLIDPTKTWTFTEATGVLDLTVTAGGSTFTVTYDGNGSTGGAVPTDGSSPYASGANVTVLGNTGSLTNTGYAFTGWNTAANGSGTSYAAAANFSITTNTILYAQWIVTYASWAEAHGMSAVPSADTDHDGVSNGVEYFMGAASGFTTSPGLNGANTVTWTNGGNIPPSAYGTQYVVQTSNDLKTWANVLVGALLSNTAGPGGSLSYTLTGAAPRFVRLVVTPN